MSKRWIVCPVRILRGEATEILHNLSEPYDVIFVDADWQDYPKWLPHFAMCGKGECWTPIPVLSSRLGTVPSP